jgi:hypothetical protein
MDLKHVLASGYVDSDVRSILGAPVTALSDVSEEAATALKSAFKIETVESLGKNALFRFAQAMLVMGGLKNDAVHSDWSGKLLRDALDEAPSVVPYITADSSAALKGAGISTIRDMGGYLPFRQAQGLIALGEGAA